MLEFFITLRVPIMGKKRSEYELGVTGLVGRTFNLWSRKLPIYIIIVGIIGVALVVFQAISFFSMFGLAGFPLLEFIGTSPLDAIFSLVLYELPIGILVPVIILSLIGLLVYAVVAGAAIRYSLIDYKRLGAGDLNESFSFALELAVPLIAVQLVQSLIILGLASLAVLSLYYQPIISLLLIITMLYIAARLAPALAVVIAEERPPINALSRSWQMTGGSFWHVFFSQLLMAIVFLIVTITLSVVIGIGFSFILSVEVSVLISTLVTSLLLSSLNYIFQTVIYKDLEAREKSKEYNRVR